VNAVVRFLGVLCRISPGPWVSLLSVVCCHVCACVGVCMCGCVHVWVCVCVGVCMCGFSFSLSKILKRIHTFLNLTASFFRKQLPQSMHCFEGFYDSKIGSCNFC
jgi:hypothetical protein